MKRIPQDEWEWYGLAAHFICGRFCRFHIATVVGDAIISTVGEYHPYNKPDGEPETIGADRLYETMVFKTGATCECGCGMPMPDVSAELDFAGYNDPREATRGHMRFCRKWARMASTLTTTPQPSVSSDPSPK